MSFIDPLGAQPCDPFFDPFCGFRGERSCDPRRDLFCFPFAIFLPFIRAGGGGGGGTGRERPRRLNLALIPPGIFRALESNGEDDDPGFGVWIGCGVCKTRCDAVRILQYIGCAIYAYQRGRRTRRPTTAQECLAVANAEHNGCLIDCERNYCGKPGGGRR